jgi:ubiquinone/menaquinone biosynthesis C-methylase UbiE
MLTPGKIVQKLRNCLLRKKVAEADAAYNIWASTYDKQKDNPIAYLNGCVFKDMLSPVDVEDKIVVDIGCGTGTSWEPILSKKPSKIIGYDISIEMLNRLRQKYPMATTFHFHGNALKEMKDSSCDLIVSTLVIGYIKNISVALAEWNRILKKGGQIIITDFHPVALQNGGNRSFTTHDGNLIFIKNYKHPLNKIRLLAQKMQWQETNLIERKIDESVKFFFNDKNMHVYEKDYGSLILYGLHFKKADQGLN